VRMMSPGIILTGTPAGCGFQLEPARYLTAGDVIRAEIDGLGEMVTTVADESVRGAERTSGG
jgi:2-keto-4-pentenoate hydratase/2-oxohepta-3-ene-1,7-dioic acid hydratase in catechol pathway